MEIEPLALGVYGLDKIAGVGLDSLLGVFDGLQLGRSRSLEIVSEHVRHVESARQGQCVCSPGLAAYKGLELHRGGGLDVLPRLFTDLEGWILEII